MRSLRRARRDGDPVLAACTAADGTELAGTRAALYLGEHRVPWDEVQTSRWDRDSEVWQVTVAGDPTSARDYRLTDAALFLELVRERVTATLVLQHQVPVRGRAGVRAVARRSPVGHGPLRWLVEYDAGLDPADPAVQQAAETALFQAREQLGEL